VIRVDIGNSSWQWDDLSFSQGPGVMSFGGLADQSLVTDLIEVMFQVGDEWVHKHLKEFYPRIEALARGIETNDQ